MTTVHAHPRPGATVTPCCAVSPTALPVKHRLTRTPAAVTCNLCRPCSERACSGNPNACEHPWCPCPHPPLDHDA